MSQFSNENKSHITSRKINSDSFHLYSAISVLCVPGVKCTDLPLVDPDTFSFLTEDLKLTQRLENHGEIV